MRQCQQPAPSTLQAVHSSTFAPPPSRASLGLHEIYDFHLENSPTHPLFVWESGLLGPRTLAWGEVTKASHRTAHFIRRHAQTPVANETPSVIAILAFTDTITSICLMIGLIRAGYQCFWISPRNSVAGLSHLLDTVGVSELIVHVDGPLRHLAASAIAESKHPVSILPLLTFADIFPKDEQIFEPFHSTPLKSLDTPAIIMHSSGSTSFPKPRTFTHRILIQQSRVPWYGEVDICNEVLSVHAVPMFHAQGLYNSCLPLSTGLILGVFSPDLPTITPTPEKLLDGLVATNSTMLICVPSFLEYWAQNPKDVTTLSNLRVIFCGGAPLNNASTAIYRENRVHISCYLAATEYGIATLMAPEQAISEGSEWLRFSPHVAPVFVPQDDPEIFELVFLSSPIHTPAVINTRIKGHDAYATSDLFSRHPSISDLWKVHGRTDDQIMLSTGEKTNPGPIEAIIGHSPYVKTCVMFGRGRFQNGIIIEPTEAFDPSDTAALCKFRSDIWPAVEEANKFAPSHSRIFKEMIIVSHPSKPFEYTLKNTPKRLLVIATYEAEIEAAYAAIAESAQEDISPPATWTLQATLPFVRSVVSEVLVPSERALDDEDDLFSRGCDSLQATWIRNSILRALRESSNSVAAKRFPLNFVYEHPSVAALTRYIVDVVACSADTDTEPLASLDVALKVKQMEDLVAKYTTNFPTRALPVTGHNFPIAPEAVVLTGSTGSLGSQILSLLVRDAAVERVYALNRHRATSARERQVAMWEDQGLDPILLQSEKISFLETDATGGLELADDISNEIRASATTIIHAAWSVDFNLTLSSFEPNIRALKTLIDLALQSSRSHPPRFIFTSTIGVLRDWKHASVVPEVPLSDLAVSVGTGYTESKCVAERILSMARGLKVVVARVGQLSGAPNGSWRTNEWVPAMVKSGRTLGALPNVEGCVSWIPTQTAASALLEMSRADLGASDEATFVHIVHPHPVPWRTIFEPLAGMLGLPLVSYYEWVSRLEKSTVSLEDAPAVKLLGFFKNARFDGGARREAMGFPRLETRKTEELASRAMREELGVLGSHHVESWVRHWRMKGFLE